jgi:hypothetical protein
MALLRGANIAVEEVTMLATMHWLLRIAGYLR